MLGKIPMRRCTGCGEMKEKKSLIRIVRTPEGEIKLDRTGKTNGRGAYLCDDPACLAAARKKKALNRAFKIQIPDSIYEELTAEMQAAGQE